MTRAILSYCIENQFAAAKIINALEGKAQIDKVIFDADNGITLLEKYFNNSNAPILILVSDNFLKSEKCMNGALELVQKIGTAKRLIPVTTDGIYTREGSNEFVHIPTTFDRVSNVIQYMNYWQDKYLDMRKSKPTGVDEIRYSDEIRTVRNISSEVGEMLRYMRAMEYYSTDQFEESNFIILYRILGIDIPSHLLNKKPEAAVSHTVYPVVEEKAMTNTVEISENQHHGEFVKNGVNGAHHDLDISKDPDLSQLPHTKPSEVKETIAPIADMSNAIKQPEINSLETTESLEALIEDIKKDTQYIHTSETNSKAESNISEVLDDIVNENDAIVDKVIHSDRLAGVNEIETLFTQNEEPLVEKPLENIYTNAKSQIVEHNSNIDINTDNKVDNFDFVHPLNNENPNIMENKNPSTSQLMIEDILQHEAENIQRDSNTEGVEDEALLSLRDALDNDPTNAKFQFDYANKLIELQQYQEAIEQLELLVEMDRTNIDAYMLMAYAAEQSGDYLLSLNCLEKVTLLKPDYPGIFYKLGTLVNERFKGPKRKAIRYFSDAVKHNPQDANAHFQLAKLEIESGADKEIIVAHLEDTLTHNPNHAEAAMELAKVNFELGHTDVAVEFYKRACTLQPLYKTEANDALFIILPPEEVIAEPELEPEPTPVNDNGKVVMITGATSGIGKATADIFAKNGYRLILTGRRNDRLEDIKAHLGDMYHNRNSILNFDVRDLDAVKKAMAEIEADFQDIDILINNAGLASGLAPIHEGDIEDWDKMIDTNIKGLLYMTRAVAPSMVERKKGHIINVSSIAGKEIYPNGNVYIASKHAVDALTKAMRVDLFKHNIKVSQVAPGAVEETEFSLVRFHGDAEKAKIYEDFTPINARDVAESIYFIASSPAHVNIQDIVLMGTQQANAVLFDRSGRKE